MSSIHTLGGAEKGVAVRDIFFPAARPMPPLDLGEEPAEPPARLEARAA
jgi:hypothetical protein